MAQGISQSLCTTKNMIKNRAAKIKKSKVIFSLYALVSCATVTPVVHSNIGGPGPLIYFGASLFSEDSEIRWIIAAMVTCIVIEGVIYHYLKLVDHPYLKSFLANIASLFLGVPIIIVGIPIGLIFGTLGYIIGTTIISIIAEVFILDFLSKNNIKSLKNFVLPVVSANIFTGTILVIYLALTH